MGAQRIYCKLDGQSNPLIPLIPQDDNPQQQALDWILIVIESTS